MEGKQEKQEGLEARDIIMEDALALQAASKRLQVLYTLRMFIECRHRTNVMNESVFWPFSPRLTPDGRKIDKQALRLEDSHSYQSRHDLPVPGRQAFEGIVGCGNKTVPIYVFAREGVDQHLPMAKRRMDMLGALDLYIYTTWRKPFKANIDCEQYFAKIIVPRVEPRRRQFGPPSWINLARDYVGVALTLSKGLCDSFVQAQNAPGLKDEIYQFRCFKIRPLFRALAIVILEQDYDDNYQKHKNYNNLNANIDKMRVLLVSTGETDGLTAPITLPNASTSPLYAPSSSSSSSTKPPTNVSIEITTLSAAVQFIMSMEERESPAEDQLNLPPIPAIRNYMHTSHPPQNPCHSFLRSIPRPFLWTIGWRGEPIDGPSSSWVDLTKYQYPGNIVALSENAVMAFQHTDGGRRHMWEIENKQKRQIFALWTWHSNLQPNEQDRTSGRRSGMWIFRFCSGMDDGSPELAHIISRPMLLATGHGGKKAQASFPQSGTGSCRPQ